MRSGHQQLAGHRRRGSVGGVVIMHKPFGDRIRLVTDLASLRARHRRRDDRNGSYPDDED